MADCLTRHDWARLRSIAQSQVPAIRLVAYHTPDEGFVACQAFEYSRVGGAAPHGVAHRAFRPRGVAEYVVMRRNRTVCGIVRFPAISGAGRIVDNKMEEICC